MTSSPAFRRPMLIYWGRRGPMTQLARDLVQAGDEVGAECSVSLSQHNLGVANFRHLGSRLVEVPTFQQGWAIAAGSWRALGAWRRLKEGIVRNRSDCAVILMPHVWSPLIVPRLRAAGIPVAVIIHDARGHLGDATGLVNRWLLKAGHQADVVVTLSQVVSANLIASGFNRANVHPLFHPDLAYARPPLPDTGGRRPLRLLMFGRVLPYKGLWVCVDALRQLRQRGVAFTATLVGEGDLGGQGERLNQLGVRVINRWVADEEIAEIFAAHDAIVLTHVEASQSGVIAAASAQGLPAIATPVGGLIEQVRHMETGLVAEAVSPEAVVKAIQLLANDRNLLLALRAGLVRHAGERSPAVFLQAVISSLQEKSR